MAKTKTAISIEKHLFEEIAAVAEEMQVSRSYLFTIAAQDFIEHHKNQKLLDAINAAYNESPEEDRLRTRMKSKHRRLVKERW